MDEWDEHDRRYLAGMKEQADVQAVLKVLRDAFEFDDDSIEQAARVLAACYAGHFRDSEAEAPPMTMKRFLTGLPNGYGCWLGEIEQAVGKAEMEELDRAFMLGALSMAQEFLYMIERREP